MFCSWVEGKHSQDTCVHRHLDGYPFLPAGDAPWHSSARRLTRNTSVEYESGFYLNVKRRQPSLSIQCQQTDNRHAF
jgi:hypothetical protein